MMQTNKLLEKKALESLKKSIIKEFSSKKAQEIYIKEAEKGLWPSEKILIKKYFKPKSFILDVGCGTGRTTIPLYKLGYNILGIDITPMMIKNAKRIAKSKKLGIRYEVRDVTALKFKNEFFDNVLFSYNGWTQIPKKENRIKALKEICRVLKPDGCFIFTTHIRKLKGFTLFWIKQWIKIYILKPLGFNIKEMDFGDRFFYDRNRKKQFIHIPSLKEINEQISIAGFKLIFNEKSNIISPKDNQKFPPMFYVCKK